MTDTTLYAWGIQAYQGEKPLLSRFEHTWVTTYEEKVDPNNHPDPPADWKPPESYWYCWGSAHNVAERALQTAPASLEAAKTICVSNEIALPPDSPLGTPSSTSGTIEFYGLDGVCQNVTNQILYPTGTPDKAPLRVNQAHGYPLVSFFFGNYGLNRSDWNQMVQKVAPDVKEPGDDFLVFMNEFVPTDKHSTLLEIRLGAQIGLSLLREKAAKKNFNYDYEMDAIVVAALIAVDAHLGSDTMFKLFPATDIRNTDWLKLLI